MKSRNKFVLASGLLASLCCAVGANAEENPLYFGIKAGYMNADQSGFDRSSNIGLLLGYDFYRDVSGVFSVEGEYTRDLSTGNFNVAGVHGNWKVETLAGYGAYRTAGDFYVKAKIGYLREDVTVSGIGSAISGKDSGLSYGAGVGYRFNSKTGLELEYTAIETDISFISLGYFTHF